MLKNQTNVLRRLCRKMGTESFQGKLCLKSAQGKVFGVYWSGSEEECLTQQLMHQNARISESCLQFWR